MIMGDTESCSSRAVDFPPILNRNHRLKVDIYNEVLRRLKDLNVAESNLAGFEDNLWSHFLRLPTRYALDINVERAQDVIVHRRLLQMAHSPAARPAIDVRLVQVRSAFGPDLKKHVETPSSNYSSKQSIHHPPAFGLSPDLELVLEANHLYIQDCDSNKKSKQVYPWAMHEITISTIDKPKLLSQLTSLMSEIGLNIQEAHAYSTSDGYSLDVFVVDGWEPEDTEQLRDALAKEIQNIEVNYHVKSPVLEQNPGIKFVSNQVSLPLDGNGIWEIDTSMLKYERKIACGSSGDLFKGILHNQDVAIKVLRAEHLNEMVQREFDQEVYMMRKLQHKNVVKFLGACTRPPNLCIITEFMSGGSMYDFLRQNGAMPLQSLLRVAIDVTEGMNYLHQNNIVHRDLKAANLLINQHGVVKVSDFGVARVQDQSGVMTAETGTYRWMAPEVIEHKPYDQKADIFSFGIVLWELLTGKLPYENLTPLQAAVGVVQKGLRPTIPRHPHPMLVALIEKCWHQDPSLRPEFSEILEILQNVASRLQTGESTSRRRIRQE